MTYTVQNNSPKVFTLDHKTPSVFTLNHNNPSLFSVIQILLAPIVNYWLTYMDYLWLGLNDANSLISERYDHRQIFITGRDFVSDFIPDASLATFKLQPDADFKLDDAPDHLWFDIAGNQRTVTANELCNFDYTRTVIKCLHSSPYDIYAIGLLRSDVVLTPVQIDQLHHDFELWIFWNGIYNDFGYLKDNRLIP